MYCKDCKFWDSHWDGKATWNIRLKI